MRKEKQGGGGRNPKVPIQATKNVMVQARVGKEFPDMKENEREIKFIRVEDAVRTAGQLKAELTLNRGPLVHFYTQGTRNRIRGFAGHLLIG